MSLAKVTIAACAILLAACGEAVKGPGSKSLSAPTSLGTLVQVEYRDSVKTDAEPLVLNPDELFCVLRFEGRDSLEYKEVEVSKVFDLLERPLVDVNGKEFEPVFSGTPGPDGTLSSKSITTNATMGGKDGKWISTGKIVIPGSTVVLVYRIPKNASGLALKDGATKLPIE